MYIVRQQCIVYNHDERKFELEQFVRLTEILFRKE